jgi:hypothetical protein
VFDIETWGLGGEFALGVCKSDKETVCFTDKDKLADYMLSRKFKNYVWFAHNLKYDLSVLFRNDIFKKFKIIMSNGRLIQLIYNKNGYNIYLRDSLNLFPMPLDAIGKALGFNKLKTPAKFKIHPNTEHDIRKLIDQNDFDSLHEIYGLSKEDIEDFLSPNFNRSITQEDIEYCIRDCDILYNAIEYIQNFLSQFNIRLRSTLGSNALAIFLTMHADKKYFKVSGYDFLFRNSYYGGRTELFIPYGENLYYYDFNSLYPSVMYLEQFPDPESLTFTNKPTIDLIFEYEGTSYVQVYVPEYLDYPPLPVKLDNKLIFPVGTFKGWYNHNELRMAVKYGAKILNVYKTVYATRTVNYFKEYISTLYSLRKMYNEQNNKIMSLICKLLMNSLYGKFGQKNVKREIGLIDDNKEKDGYVFEPIADSNIGYWYIKDKNNKPVVEDAKHDILCWASYITSYARIYLYEKIQEVLRKNGKVYYCDTDSILCDVQLDTGKELGQLKLEDSGNFQGFAPKVYKFNNILKLKGIRRPSTIKNEYKEFRILQPLEAIRRNQLVGTPEIKIKKLKLSNDKRNNNKPINIDVILKQKELNDRAKVIYNSLKIQLISTAKNNIMKIDDKYVRFKPMPNFYYDVINRFGKFNLTNLKKYAMEMAEFENYLENNLIPPDP